MSRPIRAIPVSMLAAAMLATACGARADPANAPVYAHIYDTYCSQCHGVNRNGKGVNTAGLAVQPRDHSDPKGMGSIPREEILSAIRDGGASVNKSALMPPWNSVLTDEQIEHMADYLHQVCHCGGEAK
jgi:cytochrome c oxidase cbb3-type subunit 3